jgi:anthranilate synthase component 1
VRARTPLITEIAVSETALRELANREPDRFPVFFDSAARGPLTRFSILATHPKASLTRDARGRLDAKNVALVPGGFLDNLDAWLARERADAPALPSHLPFIGGWFVYLSYEMAGEIEPRLRLPPANAGNTAFALRVDTLVIQDHVANTAYAVSADGDSVAHENLLATLKRASQSPVPEPTEAPALESLVEEDPDRFLSRVDAAKEYIAAGDIYQANLSRPWHLKVAESRDVTRIYPALRRSNPAPFAARVSWQGHSILSSSPERLLQITGRNISTRPIAGTRPRRGTEEQDRADIAELVQHPKERAEHVMLIDLERSDLGRVCEPGSVVVDEYMVTETYTHVHHIVSNVRGRLRADATAVDAMRALFPGGTITGCPKFRCMQIIAELEGEGRGAYTGSLGWLGSNGDADFNILIRTLSVKGAHVELRAGAGIVADSDPERELEETRAKARGMLRAFGAE